MRALLILSLALAGLSAAAHTQQIAITGGTAYTMKNEERIENATILVSDGKIESVSAGGAVPEGYRVIDAGGAWVTPGLMAAGSTLGLVEVSLSGGLVDASVDKEAKKPIALDVTWAINPDSTLIPVTRLEGVTRAATGLSRTDSLWLGQGAVIHLGTGADLLVQGKAFVALDMRDSAAGRAGDSRVATWQAVFDRLQKAEPEPEMMAPENTASQAGSDKDKKEKEPDPEDIALERLFSGEAQLVIWADRAVDIRNAIRLKARFGVNVVLMSAAEAWRLADDLAKAQIPVVVNVMANLPSSFDQLGATQANAARLHAAGVTLGLITDDSYNTRLLPQYAGNAVANGLPWAAAMAALTTGPAQIYGIGGQYGTLEAGKDADIVVWSGDPLELDTAPLAVLIRGEAIPLASRQSKLRDRYQSLPRSPALQR